MDVDIQMIDKALAHVRRELIRATKLHGRMRSMHEGYAVLKEEVDELWDEVKRNDQQAAWNEAVQVAAMATRFLIDNEPPTAPLDAMLPLPPDDYCPAVALAARQAKELRIESNPDEDSWLRREMEAADREAAGDRRAPYVPTIGPAYIEQR